MPSLPDLGELTRVEHVGPALTGDNVDAKKVVGYVWNPYSSMWERSTGNGGTTQLIARYDYSGNPIYVGSAPTGSHETDSVWLITAYDLSSSSDASGLIASNVEWTSRASVVYG